VRFDNSLLVAKRAPKDRTAGDDRAASDGMRQPGHVYYEYNLCPSRPFRLDQSDVGLGLATSITYRMNQLSVLTKSKTE